MLKQRVERLVSKTQEHAKLRAMMLELFENKGYQLLVELLEEEKVILETSAIRAITPDTLHEHNRLIGRLESVLDVLEAPVMLQEKCDKLLSE